MVVAWIREWSFHTRNNFVSTKSLGQKEFVKRSVNVHQSWTRSKSSATAGKYWGDKATSKSCIQEMERVCNRLGEGETLDRGSLWQEDWSIKRKGRQLIADALQMTVWLKLFVYLVYYSNCEIYLQSHLININKLLRLKKMREALDWETNSPRQCLRKYIKNNMKNMDIDVSVYRGSRH